MYAVPFAVSQSFLKYKLTLRYTVKDGFYSPSCTRRGKALLIWLRKNEKVWLIGYITTMCKYSYVAFETRVSNNVHEVKF